MEALEPRQMLAVITVDNLADNTVTDGLITLREAIIAANNDTVADSAEVPEPGEQQQKGNGDDTILFDSWLDGGTIVLDYVVPGSNPERGDDLDITKSLIIDASSLAGGLTIDATHPDDQGSGAPVFLRIFNIIGAANDETTVELKGLVLTGGNATTSDGTGFDGGAIRSVDANLTVTDSFITGNQADNGGGIFADVRSGDGFTRQLRIENSVVSGNSATKGSQSSGGGIYAYTYARSSSPSPQDPSTIQVIDSIISNNTAMGSGGGATLRASRGTIEVKNSTISGNVATNLPAGAGGGGLFVRATYEIPNDPNEPGVDQPEVTLDNLTISGNQAILIGGGAWLSAEYGTDFEITNSTISGNKVTHLIGEGGGLYGSSSNGPGKFTIAYSTISDNRARYKGAGIFHGGKSGDVLEITNTTISGNSDNGLPGEDNSLLGGGLFLAVPFATDLQTTLTNVTIYNNESGQPGDGGGLYTSQLVGTPPILDNTIVSGNRDASGDPSNIGGLVVNSMSSYNLIGTGGNGGLQDGVNGNKVGSTEPGSETYDDPRLFPLGDFGGPTLTHALLPDSPAVDGGDPFDQAGENEFPWFDQRGDPFNRVEGQYVDIGAYELQGGPYIPSAFPRVVGVVVSGSKSNHALFSIPGGSGEQLKTVPVGRADTITVWFDRDVDVQEAAATLTGNVTGQPVPIAPVPSGFTSGPNWTAWQYLTFSADMMELTVDATLVRDAATRQMLDGDWIDNPVTIFDTASAAFPSGDGTEGGDFVFDFMILPGDANRDNVVGLADLAIMQKHFDSATEQTEGFAFRTGDFNGDGKKTNQEDYVGLFTPNIHRVFVLWRKELEVGDMDTDLDVDFDDIPGWVAALRDQYFEIYGDLFAGLDEATVDQIVEQAIGDIDDDGDNDFDDKPLFISLLMNNGWSELFPGSL